ncbi:hypothetical protein PR202_gb05037 [Eleusine coracana subsp. coracana]|uniref:Uncharacterized protein n=1 Tax=Eleusine coracana subsp. coracana TaxID=191504 RepID=A0AAV5E609_ELECO|nr:hypothetical protein PR202_gb05037 [Eleusine coracana subsp. coracana]
MGVMGRLRIFVVKEPVVAASCLIAGFGNPLFPHLALRTDSSASALCSCVYVYALRSDLLDAGLFLPAVVRPILDSFETAKQVPQPTLSDCTVCIPFFQSKSCLDELPVGSWDLGGTEVSRSSLFGNMSRPSKCTCPHNMLACCYLEYADRVSFSTSIHEETAKAIRG